jgi:glucokinase
MPSPSEGGHADFSARTPREFAAAEELTRIHGRVDVERIVSGPGSSICSDSRTARRTCGEPAVSWAVTWMRPSSRPRSARAHSKAAASSARKRLTCSWRPTAPKPAISALRSVATAGVYIGGGIAPKILPALESGGFMDAFLDKSPMADWMRMLPVAVILNQSAGLLGAAVRGVTRER